jgi:hypothetical protein
VLLGRRRDALHRRQQLVVGRHAGAPAPEARSRCKNTARLALSRRARRVDARARRAPRERARRHDARPRRPFAADRSKAAPGVLLGRRQHRGRGRDQALRAVLGAEHYARRWVAPSAIHRAVRRLSRRDRRRDERGRDRRVSRGVRAAAVRRPARALAERARGLGALVRGHRARAARAQRHRRGHRRAARARRGRHAHVSARVSSRASRCVRPRRRVLDRRRSVHGAGTHRDVLGVRARWGRAGRALLGQGALGRAVSVRGHDRQRARL